jgi:hypothetical protein
VRDRPSPKAVRRRAAKRHAAVSLPFDQRLHGRRGREHMIRRRLTDSQRPILRLPSRRVAPPSCEFEQLIPLPMGNPDDRRSLRLADRQPVAAALRRHPVRPVIGVLLVGLLFGHLGFVAPEGASGLGSG